MKVYGIRATKLTRDQFAKKEHMGVLLFTATYKKNQETIRTFITTNTTGYSNGRKRMREVTVTWWGNTTSLDFFLGAIEGYKKVSFYHLDNCVFNPCNKKH